MTGDEVIGFRRHRVQPAGTLIGLAVIWLVVFLAIRSLDLPAAPIFGVLGTLSVFSVQGAFARPVIIALSRNALLMRHRGRVPYDRIQDVTRHDGCLHVTIWWHERPWTIRIRLDRLSGPDAKRLVRLLSARVGSAHAAAPGHSARRFAEVFD